MSHCEFCSKPLKMIWRADEALRNQLAHVAHRRGVAERESELGLEPLRLGERSGPPRVTKVVRDRLFAEDVFAGLECRPRELEMRVARRAHVDDVDVVALQQLAMIAGRRRNLEARGGVAGQRDVRIGDGDDAASRIAAIPWQVRGLRPGAGAEHADANHTI